MPDRLRVAHEVRAALADGRGVVALESTLVTHGLPAPRGLEVAAEMEEAVRRSGCVPATIGVLEGWIYVGLAPAQLERLARGAEKLSLSNLGTGLSSGRPGSTTVAATSFAAHRAGISVFATGGIGGVHHDAADTDDVSADLIALSRYPVAVVCSGAKAILDLRRTRERLETLGVPVLGYATDNFPAFYRRDSDLGVDARLDSVPALAAAVRAHFELGLGTGIVVANPIPSDDELPLSVYQGAIAAVQAEKDRSGVRGRDVTPMLLDELRDLTDGASVASNRALLLNNATLAGELAATLAANP